MCRAPRTVETYWLFSRQGAEGAEVQVGAINRDGTDGKPWIASRMRHGMPTGRQLFADLGEALAYAAGGDR
jgi:hypothetical protein